MIATSFQRAAGAAGHDADAGGVLPGGLNTKATTGRMMALAQRVAACVRVATKQTSTAAGQHEPPQTFTHTNPMPRTRTTSLNDETKQLSSRSIAVASSGQRDTRLSTECQPQLQAIATPSNTRTTALPPSAKPLNELPADWSVATTDAGDVYYYNEVTSETSWTPPVTEPTNNEE